MKKIALAMALVVGFALAGLGTSQADAAGFGGFHFGGGGIHVDIGHGGHHGSHHGYHNYRSFGHYDYHPATYTRHRNHYHYQPAHYDYHRTNCWGW